jgi:hypothetical protein
LRLCGEKFLPGGKGVAGKQYKSSIYKEARVKFRELPEAIGHRGQAAPISLHLRRFSRNGHWAAVACVILLFAFIRIRLQDFPLERDEGEYAYMGQLMLQGIPPYQLAYNMKLPGTYAAYAAILALFGQTPAAIHWGLILINSATTVLLYLLGAHLSGRPAGVVACACFALLSAGQTVMGISAHATHFVILPALAGILVLLRAMEKRHLLLYLTSGILVGLAFLMKQPGIFLALFAGSCLVCDELRQRPVEARRWASRAGTFAVGAIAPFAVTCLILFESGVFDTFWFWTFDYARAYGSIVMASDGLFRLAATFPKVASPAAPIWILAAFGLTAPLLHPPARSHGCFYVGFALCSFLAVCPGYYFRPHYFILLLPATALLAGLAVSSAAQYFMAKTAFPGLIPVLCMVLAFGYSVSRQSRFFFELDPGAACRESYGISPFPDSPEIAKYLRDHTGKDARIAVLGSEPQIYFYSGRRSATGFLYMYGLMEDQKYALRMQREMIAEIEKSSPEFVVFVHIPSSWARRLTSENLIFNWADQYLMSRYILEGIVEIFDSDPSEYRWGEAARSYVPRSQNTIGILKRK